MKFWIVTSDGRDLGIRDFAPDTSTGHVLSFAAGEQYRVVSVHDADPPDGPTMLIVDPVE